MTFDFCWSCGRILCALAVACPQFLGSALFWIGVRDFDRGCREMKNGLDPTLRNMKLLRWVMPFCALLRVFFVPALWFHLAEEPNLSQATHSVAVVLWVACFLLPYWMLLRFILMPGFRCALSSYRTINEWPEECAVQRPYHGLVSTRCHIAHGSFLVELLWTVWIIYQGPNHAYRVGGISVPMVAFNVALLIGGPINYLSRGPRRDAWVAYGFLIISTLSCDVMLVFAHAPFGLRNAVIASSNHGPYSNFICQLWLLTAAFQAFSLRFMLNIGEELKPRPPWQAGGCDHKEFYRPRFAALVAFCFVQLVSYNLWVTGCGLWFWEVNGQ